MVWSRKWVTPTLPPGLVESTFRLSGGSPLTGELGVERMKQWKLEHGEHAADTLTNNHTPDRLQLHVVAI